MNIITIILIFCNSFSIIFVLTQYLDIELEDGIVRGKEAIDRKDQIYYSFRGIPYALPPVGDLRFQPPQKNKPWIGLKNAFNYGPSCPQINFKNFGEKESEDCLYLNVFVPSVNIQTKLKPVLVYIHGGGLIFGSGGSFELGPENLVAEDIILVTFNYRLGIYGFLKLKDPSLKIFGNMGLKDQVAVLKWVNKNIKKFGGDPKRVTIVGNSSGAMCVHAHMLSPLSKDLFHGAILESGTVFSFNLTFDIFGVAKVMNQYIDLPLKNEKDALKIFDYFYNTSAKNQIFLENNNFSELYNLFGLEIEDLESPEPFINEPIDEKILMNNYVTDVPMIIGYNNEEAIEFYKSFNKSKDTWFSITDSKFARILINQSNFSSFKERKFFENILLHHYLSDDNYTDLYRFFHLKMDLTYFMAIYKVIKSRLANLKQKTYIYRFIFDTQLNYVKSRDQLNYPGACHADELGYLFRQEKLYPKNIPQNSLENLGITIMTTLWSNFVKTGNPNYPNQKLRKRWVPSQNGIPLNLEIGPKLKMLSNFVEKDRIEFWEKLEMDYNNFLKS